MKLLKFNATTLIEAGKENERLKPIYINPANIVFVEEKEDDPEYSVIHVVNGYITVNEPIDDVALRIRMETK